MLPLRDGYQKCLKIAIVTSFCLKIAKKFLKNCKKYDFCDFLDENSKLVPTLQAEQKKFEIVFKVLPGQNSYTLFQWPEHDVGVFPVKKFQKFFHGPREVIR